MKKNFLKISAVLTAGLLITGCASKEEIIQDIANQQTEANYMDAEFQGAPSWVLMPVLEGFIAEVGIAKKNAANDIAFQRTEAMANARDNLARQISINVDNTFKSFKASTGSGANETFDKASETASKQVASQSLSNTVVKDVWVSKTGNMYVFMVVNTESVAQKAENAVKSSFGNDEALYQKFLAEKAQGELDKELEKRR